MWGCVGVYAKEDRQDIIKLINRYYQRDCVDEELELYSKVCETLKRVVFNYGEYNKDYLVYKMEDKFLVGIKDSEYELGVKMRLCHRNVENIHYDIREVTITNGETITTIRDSDGYIKVETLELAKEVV